MNFDMYSTPMANLLEEEALYPVIQLTNPTQLRCFLARQSCMEKQLFSDQVLKAIDGYIVYTVYNKLKD